jgi:hypothetical protein
LTLSASRSFVLLQDVSITKGESVYHSSFKIQGGSNLKACLSKDVCTQYYQGEQGGSIAKSIFYFIETDIPQVAATHRVINLKLLYSWCIKTN